MAVSSVIAIDGGTVLTPRDKFSPGRIIIDGKSIVEVGSPRDVPVPASAERIDATPFFVTPGFIEPHIHGCGGTDVMDGSHEALNVVSRIVARHGTTSFLPTTVSSPPDILTRTVEKIGNVLQHTFEGAQPLGIHLEGPFINTNRRGTHKATHIVAPDLDLLHRWISQSQGSVKLITIAPELDPDHTISTMAEKYGVRVAMGHSNATFEEATAAVGHGVCYAVHTFNAMRSLSHRDPGIVGTVLSDDRVFAEIIADGVHVDPSLVRIFARAKQARRILLVTDATSATDMPDGEYILGPDRVIVNNGVCRDSEGRLAGSTLTQEVALKNFITWTGFSLENAIFGLTENPAHALSLHGKGVIGPGADADLAVFDHNFHVVKTFVAGKLVFER